MKINLKRKKSKYMLKSAYLFLYFILQKKVIKLKPNIRTEINSGNRTTTKETKKKKKILSSIIFS
jgi:hypothetical protein